MAFRDVDNPSNITIDDAAMTLQAYTNQMLHVDAGVTDDVMKAMDLDEDGFVAIDNATYILAYYTTESVTPHDLVRDNRQSQRLGRAGVKSRSGEAFSAFLCHRTFLSDRVDFFGLYREIKNSPESNLKYDRPSKRTGNKTADCGHGLRLDCESSGCADQYSEVFLPQKILQSRLFYHSSAYYFRKPLDNPRSE